MADLPESKKILTVEQRTKGGKKVKKELKSQADDIDKQMRWIGRDLLRISMFMEQVGNIFKNAFGAMVTHSLTLGAAIEDVTWVMDEMASITGDAVSPAFDALAEIMEGLLGWFEQTPEWFQMLAGGAVMGMMAILSLITTMMALFGMFMIVQYGAVMLTEQLAGVGVNMTGLSRVMKVLVTPLKWVSYLFGMGAKNANKFNLELLQTRIAANKAGKGLLRLSAVTKSTSRSLGKYIGLSMMLVGTLTSITAGMTGTISPTQAVGGALASIGMGLMLIIPGWGALIGGFVMAIGAILGLASAGEELGSINQEVFRDLQGEYEYTSAEAYDLEKRIRSAYKSINKEVLDSAVAFDIFREKMWDMGMDARAAELYWIALGGSAMDMGDSVGTGAAAIEQALLSMASTAEGAMALIRLALVDGTITSDEWAAIMNTTGYSDLLYQMGFIESSDFTTQVGNALADGQITQTEWEGFMNSWIAGGVLTDIYDDAEDTFNDIVEWLGTEGNQISEDDWADWLNMSSFRSFQQEIALFATTLSNLRTRTLRPFLDLTQRIVSAFSPWMAQAFETATTEYRGPMPFLASVISGEFQGGGIVPETGPYILHAGEYVVPPGGDSYGDVNVNIANASIRSEQDIYDLARAISEIQSDRARRRGVM